MAPRTITTIINVHCTAIIISNSYAELKTYKIKSGIQQKKKSTQRARDREIGRKRKKLAQSACICVMKSMYAKHTWTWYAKYALRAARLQFKLLPLLLLPFVCFSYFFFLLSIKLTLNSYKVVAYEAKRSICCLLYWPICKTIEQHRNTLCEKCSIIAYKKILFGHTRT